MRCLLDTHALAWWLFDDPRLGTHARQVIADRQNDIFVSTVSGFEVSMKFRLGKWDDIGTLVTNFEALVRAENFDLLSISTPHAVAAGMFDSLHRDPFDRILAAQCRLDALSLISVDKAFQAFGIDVIW